MQRRICRIHHESETPHIVTVESSTANSSPEVNSVLELVVVNLQATLGWGQAFVEFARGCANWTQLLDSSRRKLRWRRGAYAMERGRVNQNVVGPSRALSTPTSPPCISTNALTMVRPNPAPLV